ncbi:MAG: hypothetical protein N3H31_07035 [Candidatus Nezhaarchaeota archaeon]|nr:hypothetical protein [Candidatus Nezhaarchaeota archaeon]
MLSVERALISLAPALIVASASALLTFTLTPAIIKRHRSLGIVGRDVHKPDAPLIPEMGGLSIVASTTAGSLLVALMVPELRVQLLAFLATFLIAAAIGAYDDLRVLGPRTKTLLTVLCCLPIIVGALASPHEISIGRPVLPLVGPLRLTIIYWALLPFAIAVPANAVNMMDVFNGVMPATCLLALLALLASGILLDKWVAVYLSAPLIGSLAAYYYFNRYPAKVFSGDVGSLSVGAAIGAIAVLSGLEAVGVVALMPHITNAFHSLASVGGLFERRELSVRPVLVKGPLLEANPSQEAPLTLANLILSAGPLSEREVVGCFISLSAVSSALAVATAALMTIKL